MQSTDRQRVKDVRVTECPASRFIQPQRIHYTQDGKQKAWDMCALHDSVSVLIYNRDKDALVLVKQLRPPVMLSHTDGFTIELCSGLVDKRKTLHEITREEILEETGYDIAAEDIHQLTSFHTAVGISSSKQTLFYCTVTDAQRTQSGGGIEDESIEILHVPASQLMPLILDDRIARPPNLMFMLQWFLASRDRFLPETPQQTPAASPQTPAAL